MKRGGNQPRMFWDTFLNAYPVKATALLLIAALTVVSCGKEGSMSRALSKLNYYSAPAKAPRLTKPADKLHAAVTELKDLLRAQARRDLSDEQAGKAREARARIGTELGALGRQFDRDRRKLLELGAESALGRLAKIERKAAGLEHSVQMALAQVPRDGSRATVAATDAASRLAALSPEKPQQPLSSELGFGADNATPRSVSLSAGITPAYNSPTATEASSELPRDPEQADLGETAETEVTPAVHELGQQLDGDPVKIYEYVRNNVRFEPYLGVRKGADQTLAEKTGSDADQAALLIALLRDSGIHARFVRGVAQLPAAKAANWLGVDTQAGERLDAAPDILASAGIPTSGVRANGALTKVRFEHIWAEAYVPNDAYRGIEEQPGGKTWLPLDPSIKQSVFKRPDDEVKSALQPISDQAADDFVRDSSPIGDYGVVLPNAGQLHSSAATVQNRLKELIIDRADGDLKVDDVVGSTKIRSTASTYLPSTLPVQALSVSAELRAIPTNLRAGVKFTVSGSDPLSLPSSDPENADGGGLSFTAPTMDLGNKRITLAYVPATENDAEIIDAYHGLLNAPTYGASLVPVLRVDGRVVARGHTAVSTGYTQTFEITYRSPGYAADTVKNPVYVGSLSAVGLDLGKIAGQQLKARAHALEQLASSTTPQNIVTDARGGEMLSQLTSLYFLRNDTFNSVLSRAAGVHATRNLSGGITATDITPTYVASFPVGVRFDGLTIDVDQDSEVAVAKTASDRSLKSYMRLSGGYASASEAAIFEHALGWRAVSTSLAMRTAAEAGIPIHSVTSQNVDAELNRLALPAGVEAQIAKSVARPGAVVVTPEREVTVGAWTGVGYVVEAGLSADYRITGGISGGAAPSPPPSNPGLPTYDPFGPFSESVPHFTSKVEDASDCDELEIVILALVVLALVLLAVAAFLLAGQIWGGMIALEILEGVTLATAELGLTSLHIALLGGAALFVGAVALAPLIEEAEKC